MFGMFPKPFSGQSTTHGRLIDSETSLKSVPTSFSASQTYLPTFESLNDEKFSGKLELWLLEDF